MSYANAAEAMLEKAPPTWIRSKLGFISTVKARLGWKGLKADEYVAEGYVFLATPNIKEREIDFENVYYITEDRYAESPEIALKEGDVLLAKDGNTLGVSNIVRRLPRAATVNGSIAVIRPKQVLDGVYLNFFLQSYPFQYFVHQMKDGMGVPHLFQRDLRRFDVLVPPLPAQKAIADYLDEKTAAIDALIEKKRKLLDLLAEERAALINQAVTKGLDPTAAMKDSGIPWIGEIPAHWTSLQLRRVLTKIEQGWSPQCDSKPAAPDEWGVLKAGCTAGGRFEPEENKTLPSGISPRTDIEVHAGDVVMSRASGSPKIVGSVALVEQVRPMLLLSDKLFRLGFLHRRVDPGFIVASLASASARAQIENAISGAEGLANNLPQSKVREIAVSLPPLAEQREIAAHVRRREARIESLRARAQRQIDRLQEYRQALITAAVTGQLDIEAAA